MNQYLVVLSVLYADEGGIHGKEMHEVLSPLILQAVSDESVEKLIYEVVSLMEIDGSAMYYQIGVEPGPDTANGKRLNCY